MEYLALAFMAYAVIFGALGSYIADQKGRSTVEGTLFGVFLGPIGLLIVAALPAQAVERQRQPPAAEDDSPDRIDFGAIPPGGNGAMDPLATRRKTPPPLPGASPDRRKPRKLLGEVSEPWMEDLDL